MSQGSFNFGTSGASTTNYTNDTNFVYLGGSPFNQLNFDFTQVVIGYSGTEPVPNEIQTYTSNWTISGTGGSGKILQILFRRGPNGGRFVIVTLVAGGGTLTDGGTYIFHPPELSCFLEGTRILTKSGYKTVESLTESDLVITSDNRAVNFKLLKTKIYCANESTAPYMIQPGAFGKDMPENTLCLSPIHKIHISNNLWTSPKRASITNPKIKQYGIGESFTYYHIECDNFFNDNLIAEGIVVESYGSPKSIKGMGQVYNWDSKLGGFTRKEKHININPRVLYKTLLRRSM